MKKKMAAFLTLVSILLVIAIPVSASGSTSSQTQVIYQTMTHGLGG